MGKGGRSRRVRMGSLTSMPAKRRVLVLIPAFNEERAVAGVAAGALTHLPVLVVDDGSSDGTASAAEAAGATVLRQTPNRGKGAALKAGLAEALARGFDAVITLDADGQHDPGEIPRFLETHRGTRADLIIGKRDFGRMPPVRRIANTLGRAAFSWALGRKVHDNQSGYRLISAGLARKLLDARESGFEFEMEMIVACVRHGLALEWVPIRTIYAGEESHIRGLPHLLRFLGFVVRIRRTIRAD